MRYIKPLEDIGAPALVSLAHEVTIRHAPEYNEYVAYGLAAIGYVAGGLGYGGQFVKNLGIAALPLAVNHLLTRLGIERRAGSRSHMAYRPAPASMSYRPRSVSQTPGPGFAKLETY